MDDEPFEDDETERAPHQHRPRTFHTVTHREGIPYEVERTVCALCGELIEERSLRRAEA